ncbi:MAG: alpha/beta hydrolase [Solobacterium sp.]|nr:alpha/beta hydrolase [Solobacterium sp.]
MIKSESAAKRYALRIRQMFHESDEQRDADLRTPEDVEWFDNILYGQDCPEWQCLDVYRPKGKEGPLPVILSVHGGGWVYGDRNVYQYYCMSLAQFGFAVVNFSYRLAPEYTYPASLEDFNSVCLWISENRERFGFDADHVFAVGDSAGAHMLSLYCCALSDQEFRSSVHFPVQDQLRFRAVALNCGVYDPDAADPGIQGLIQVLLPKESTPMYRRELNTCLHISEAFPPVFLMAANDDSLNQQTLLLKPVLEEHRVPFVYRMYGTEDHPLPHVFHCNMNLQDAYLCNKDETDFFHSFCD